MKHNMTSKSEKCYNGAPKEMKSQNVESRSIFNRSNSEKQSSNTRASLHNDTIHEKPSSQDACVQVSIDDMQSYKRISECIQGNRNFEETEEVIHETCKYCQKPHGNHYGDIKSIPKYACSCCHIHPENPHEGTYRVTSRVNEYSPRFHSSRPQLKHLCTELCPLVPACYHESCSNKVYFPIEIANNPYDLQYSLRTYDRNEFTDNKRYHPQRSKAVLCDNFQCSWGNSIESRDNRQHFEPICDFHHIPEPPLSLPNECKNFHKISNAKYHKEYSTVSDYRTPPEKNARKHVFLDKSRDDMQTFCDFNFLFDSEQAEGSKSSSDCPSSSMLKKRSDGIVIQPNCHNETSSDVANNIHLFYTSEDTRKGDPKKEKSIDIKSPLPVQNINPVIIFRSTEKENPNNVASNNSVKSPTQSQQLQQLASTSTQQDVPDVYDSNPTEKKDNGKDTQLNKSGSREKMVKEKSTISVQRASNVNVQRRYRNPLVMDGIYNKADNVLDELKKVLTQRGKWNG